jgi:hypothetical protein
LGCSASTHLNDKEGFFGRSTGLFRQISIFLGSNPYDIRILVCCLSCEKEAYEIVIQQLDRDFQRDHNNNLWIHKHSILNS